MIDLNLSEPDDGSEFIKGYDDAMNLCKTKAKEYLSESIEPCATSSEKEELTKDEIKNIEAMADETCRLSDIERRLIKEAAIILYDNLNSFPRKDLKFTQDKVCKWLREYQILRKNF